eukprot:XP_027309691.1 protein CEBPZOS isoform X2 [Anas platyrhynchos]
MACLGKARIGSARHSPAWFGTGRHCPAAFSSPSLSVRRAGAAAITWPPHRGGARRPLMAAMRRRLLAGLVVLEAAALGGVLLLYRAMDSSRDFRYTMQKRFPSILEGRLVVCFEKMTQASVASHV